MSDFIGWIKIFREIQHNWVWSDKPFSKGQAWIDLIILAKRTDEKFTSGNRIISGKRGCVYKSILYLSDRWGWDRKKTRAFLDALEEDKMITVKAAANGTTIRIENYEEYQGSTAAKDKDKGQQKDSKRTTQGQPRDSQGTAKGQLKYGTAQTVEKSWVSGVLWTEKGQQKDNGRTTAGQHLPTYKKNTTYSKEDKEEKEEGGAVSGALAPSPPAACEKSIYERMRE